MAGRCATSSIRRAARWRRWPAPSASRWCSPARPPKRSPRPSSAAPRRFGVDAIVVSAGEHAAVLQGRRSDRTAGDHDRPRRRWRHRGRRDLRAGACRRPTAAALLVARALGQQRDRRGPADRRGSRRWSGPTPHYLFVDAVQALGKLALDFAASRTRYDGGERPQDRRPGGRRRAADEGPCRPGSADPRRRAGTGPSRRHRSGGADRRVRRGGRGVSGSAIYAANVERAGPDRPRTGMRDDGARRWWSSARRPTGSAMSSISPCRA